MRKIRMVSDASADIFILKEVEFSSASIKIIADDKEFVDEMVSYFDRYKVKSRTSWLAEVLNSEAYAENGGILVGFEKR